jgi:microcystin degradation protein MlrC
MRVAVLLIALPLALCAQGRKPLIAFGGISHESDSFNPAKTTLEDFGRRAGRMPATSIEQLSKGNTVVSGFIEGSRQYGFDLHPVLLAGAAPKGPVTDEAFNTLVSELIRQVKAAPKLDGLLLSNHGAMVVESYPHGDTELLRRVRAAVGPDLPIVVVHDFHANETPEIVNLCTALIIYKENPHIDTRERGLQAAKIMADTVSGKVKPVQTIVKPPMVYNIVYQHTKSAPLLPIVEEERRLEQDPRILGVSVAGGYQYADSEQMGPAVVIITNNDRDLAEREAKRLSDMMWATRDQLKLNLPDPAAAVREAMTATKFPVALIDMGDNIGGGSSGDGTFLLEQLIAQKADGWVVVIADPAAVQAAVKAGIGGAFDMPVGGKTDQFHGKPVRARGRVKSLHDGNYIETEVRHGGGRYWSMGLTAVIEAQGSTPDMKNLLVVTADRSSPNSIHQLVSCGIYPERQKYITVKGAIAPRAAYEPVAARIINVDTPGLTAVNTARYTYKRVRRPLFGLE